MRIQDVPADQFYRLAGNALFRTLPSKRWTKRMAALRGDSCRGIVHDVWVSIAESNKNFGDCQPSTFIYNAARWERCYRNKHEKNSPTNYDQLPSDLIADQDTIEGMVDRILLLERVADALRFLTYREREVIRLRFGLGNACGKSHTLEEVGRIFKVTREVIRQIESKAINKLAHERLAKLLRGFYDSLIDAPSTAE